MYLTLNIFSRKKEDKNGDFQNMFMLKIADNR